MINNDFTVHIQIYFYGVGRENFQRYLKKCREIFLVVWCYGENFGAEN
jgi:hypothetical protein